MGEAHDAVRPRRFQADSSGDGGIPPMRYVPTIFVLSREEDADARKLCMDLFFQTCVKACLVHVKNEIFHKADGHIFLDCVIALKTQQDLCPWIEETFHNQNWMQSNLPTPGTSLSFASLPLVGQRCCPHQSCC